MIAAYGMLKVYRLLHGIQSARSKTYLQAALRIVRATVETCSTPTARFIDGQVDLGYESWDTILNQSTINYNENAAWRLADCGLVYADYYFLQIGNELIALEQKGLLSASDIEPRAG